MVTRQLLDSVQFLPKLEQELPNTGFAEWQNFIPVIVAATGSLGSYSSSMHYRVDEGGIVFFTLSIAIISNGTGSGNIQFTLPVPVYTGEYYVFPGREVNLTGTSLLATLYPTGQNVISTGTNGYPGSNGAQLIISGFYRTII